MKIGEIDVPNSIINLEFDVNVIQQVLNHLIENNSDSKKLTKDDMERFKTNAIKMLQKKYPQMGIKKI